MNVKPAKGIRVNCNPTKEAIFGEDGVEVKKTSISAEKHRVGVLTGRTLAGFAEVEMEAMDGKKHWFLTDEMLTDKGERVVEEEIPIDIPADDEGDGGAGEEDAE